MRVNDVILVIVLAILSTLPLMFNVSGNKKTAEIKVNGKVIRQIDLYEKEIFEIEAGDGHNIIEVGNGMIAVIDADCSDKTCVKTGAIRDIGDVIACVPHKLIVTIKDD